MDRVSRQYTTAAKGRTGSPGRAPISQQREDKLCSPAVAAGACVGPGAQYTRPPEGLLGPRDMSAYASRRGQAGGAGVYLVGIVPISPNGATDRTLRHV